MKVIKLAVTGVERFCVERETERYPPFLEQDVSRRLHRWWRRHRTEHSCLVMNGGLLPMVEDENNK
jgi:hypothetical protein